MIKTSVHEAVSHALDKDTPFTLLTPKDTSFGDYALNTFQLKNVDFDKLIETLLKHPLFEKIEKKDSFINMLINKKYLFDELHEIIEKKDMYGHTQKKGLRISLEYGDPNTHKLPHIGHLFSFIIGESWTRILEAAGHTLYRCSYQGDVGLHVAKCLYMIKNEITSLKNKTLEEKVHMLQKAYQDGSLAYEENAQAKIEIDDLNKKIYQNDPSIYDAWQTTRQWSLDYYGQFEKQLGITYDTHYFESMTAAVGKKTVLDNVPNIFEESDGAIVFRGEKYGSHTRVFITKLGNPTYEAKDLGLAALKLSDWPFDKAIITTASEQNAYFKVVIQATNLIFPQLVGKVSHIGFGMIDLKQGKMSSRTGNIVSAIDLVEIVKQKVVEVMYEAKQDEKKEINDETIEHIAMAAIKYSFLKSEAKKNILFDIDESVSIHGNSGPYMQYTYARTQSILKKADPSTSNVDLNLDHASLAPEELSLLRTFFRFPESIDDASNTYAPHVLCTYLFDLAQKFNNFYEKHPILNSKKQSQQFRLMLTQATAHILKNGLYLLGIQVLDRI